MTYSFIKDQNKLGTFSSFIFLLLLSLFISTGSFSQLESASSELINNNQSDSPFDAVKGKKEDLSKRDEFSKHYINEDGSYTALIGAGSIHYEKDGVWEDIQTNIVTNSSSDFTFKNTTNVFQSFYGATAHKGIKSKTKEGEVLEFQNTKMFWEVNGQETNTQTSANTTIVVNKDIATYPNLFGTISAEFTSLVGKRELNYVIPNVQEIANAPTNAEYLVFSEDITLPNNWMAISTEQGIEVKNQTGEVIYLYPKPVSTDANFTLRQEENTVYEMYQNGNILTLKTKVKTEWLLNSERQFPVKVDPTVKAYPDVTAGWTKSVASDGYNYADFQFGMDVGYFVRGFIKYNLISIPSSAIINSASGYVYIFQIDGDPYNTNAFRFKNALDPTTNSGATLYNSATTFYSADQLTNQSIGWKNSTFSSTGLVPIKNNFGGYLSLSVDPGGEWYPTGTYKMRNYIGGANGTEKPYLLINYTEPVTNPNNVVFHNYGGTDQLTFNNSRIETNTPIFRMSHSTSAATDYEVQISTAPNFSGGTSWTQTFTGTYPLNTEANFTFNNGFTPTSGTTYYVRARVRGAANVWSSWTAETYSFTYDTSYPIPNWFQTTQTQFQTDELSGVVANGSHDVVTNAGSGNVITNGSFEDGLTGWSTFQNWHTYIAEQDNYWSSSGNNSLLMWNTEPGTFGYFTEDHVGVSQIVDLTNVSNLEMEANYESASGDVQLRVYIAETTNPTGANGQLVYTWTPTD